MRSAAEIDESLDYLEERVGMLLAWRLAARQLLLEREEPPLEVPHVRVPEPSSPAEPETLSKFPDDWPERSGDAVSVPPHYVQIEGLADDMK